MNILEKANEITSNSRKVEEYGSPEQSFGKISKLASIMANKELTIEDCINVMMAVKLARESVNHKEDNLLDLAGYTRIMNDYRESKKDTPLKATINNTSIT